MKLLINGVVYDSTETPILIHFDENEQRIFDMKKFVSAPPGTSELQRSQLISMDLFDDVNDAVKKYNELTWL